VAVILPLTRVQTARLARYASTTVDEGAAAKLDEGASSMVVQGSDRKGCIIPKLATEALRKMLNEHVVKRLVSQDKVFVNFNVSEEARVGCRFAIDLQIDLSVKGLTSVELAELDCHKFSMKTVKFGASLKFGRLNARGKADGDVGGCGFSHPESVDMGIDLTGVHFDLEIAAERTKLFPLQFEISEIYPVVNLGQTSNPECSISYLPAWMSSHVNAWCPEAMRSLSDFLNQHVLKSYAEARMESMLRDW